MGNKKKRGCNYTQYEKECLLRILKKYRVIIENKETNSAAIRKKRNAWEEVARQYNAVAVSGSRSWQQLRHLYENIKQRTKKIIAKENKIVVKENPHGTYKSLLMEIDAHILSKEAPQAQPTMNTYDDGASYYGDTEIAIDEGIKDPALSTEAEFNSEDSKTKWHNVQDSYDKSITGSPASVSKYDNDRLNLLPETCIKKENISNMDLPISSCEGSQEEHDPLQEHRFTESDTTIKTANYFCTIEPVSSPTLTGTTPKLNHTGSTSDENLSYHEQHSPPSKKPAAKRKKGLIKDELNRTNPRDRKLQQFVKDTIQSERGSPTHNFFSSMADIVCKFPPEKIAEIRLGICSIVSNTELLLLNDGKKSTSLH